MRRFTLLTGVGIGYVLGARSGRERYASLLRAGRAFAERPDVQGAAGILAARVSGAWGRAPVGGARREPAPVIPLRSAA